MSAGRDSKRVAVAYDRNAATLDSTYVRTRAGERVTAAQLLKQPDVRIRSLVDSGAVTLETDSAMRRPRSCQCRDDREVRGLPQTSDRRMPSARRRTSDDEFRPSSHFPACPGCRLRPSIDCPRFDRRRLGRPHESQASRRQPSPSSTSFSAGSAASPPRRTSEQPRVSGSPLEARQTSGSRAVANAWGEAGGLLQAARRLERRR